jgi:predicted transcriptional regulator
MTDTAQLTELQLALLRVLWDRKEATVTELVEALRPERTLAPTTVATLLTRLEKRGIVGHTTRARHYVYRPRVSEAEVRRTMVSDLTERLFAGDAAALVSHLVTTGEISAGDLARVRALVSRPEPSEPSRPDTPRTERRHGRR